MNELETVVLADDMVEHGLRKGDVGAIVHVYADLATYEVEFVTGEGKTVALITVIDEQIRPMANREILHARVLNNIGW